MILRATPLRSQKTRLIVSWIPSSVREVFSCEEAAQPHINSRAMAALRVGLVMPEVTNDVGEFSVRGRVIPTPS